MYCKSQFTSEVPVSKFRLIVLVILLGSDLHLIEWTDAMVESRAALDYLNLDPMLLYFIVIVGFIYKFPICYLTH